MSTPRGFFDETQVPEGWFGPSAQIAGWFDDNLLDVSSSAISLTQGAAEALVLAEQAGVVTQAISLSQSAADALVLTEQAGTVTQGGAIAITQSAPDALELAEQSGTATLAATATGALDGGYHISSPAHPYWHRRIEEEPPAEPEAEPVAEAEPVEDDEPALAAPAYTEEILAKIQGIQPAHPYVREIARFAEETLSDAPPRTAVVDAMLLLLLTD